MKKILFLLVMMSSLTYTMDQGKLDRSGLGTSAYAIRDRADSLKKGHIPTKQELEEGYIPTEADLCGLGILSVIFAKYLNKTEKVSA